MSTIRRPNTPFSTAKTPENESHPRKIGARDAFIRWMLFTLSIALLNLGDQALADLRDWDGNAGGGDKNWFTKDNWFGLLAERIPDTEDEAAVFGSLPSYDQFVRLDQTVDVESIDFDNTAISYTLTGSGRVNIHGGSRHIIVRRLNTDWNTGIYVIAGDHTINVDLKLMSEDTVFRVKNVAGVKDKLTINGDISGGPGLIIESDSGQQIEFGGDNSYNGSTTIEPNGYLQLLGGDNLPNAKFDEDNGDLIRGLVQIESGGILDLNGTDEAIAHVQGAGDVLLGGGNLILQNPGNGGFSGTIKESGKVTILQDGALIFGRIETADLEIDHGEFLLGSGDKLGSDTDVSIHSGGVLRLYYDDESFRSLTLDGGSISSRNGSDMDLSQPTTFLTGGGIFFVETGTLTLGLITGNGPLSKTGNGRLDLTAQNTYSGNIEVNDGTLSATLTYNSSSSIRVKNGASLDVRGHVGDLTVESGGKLKPGGNNEIGVFQVDNATLEGGAVYEWEIADATGGSRDALFVEGYLFVNTGSDPIVIKPKAIEPIENFNNTQTYSWPIAATRSTSIIGYSPSRFQVEPSGSGWHESARWRIEPNPNVTALNLVYYVPPVATDQSLELDEDESLPLTLAGTDASGESLTYHIVDSPTHGRLSGTGANRTYTPSANYFGSDHFTFHVNNGTYSSDPATVELTVSPKDDPPIAQDDWFYVAAGSDDPAFLNVLANDTDPDLPSDNLRLTRVDSQTATAVIEGHQIKYTQNSGETDPSIPDTFTYTISDNNGTERSATVTVTKLPEHLFVDTILDTAASEEDFTSLRRALELAQLRPGDETIHLPKGQYSLNLGSLDIDDANGITIQAEDNPVVLEASEGQRLFKIQSGTVFLHGLTLQGGAPEGDGGAILNTGDLSLIECTLTDNHPTKGSANGGAIHNSGTLWLERTTVHNNSAQEDGGGIFNQSGRATLINSTISGNFAEKDGGGVMNLEGSLTVHFSTITSNVAATSGRSDAGGGISSPTKKIELFNTIVTRNTLYSPNGTADDIDASVKSESAHNYIGTGADGMTDGENGNHVGTPETPLIEILRPLANYGGPTPAHALMRSEGIENNAIDGGNGVVRDRRGEEILTILPDTDQRGQEFGRVFDVSPDIGAFEYQPFAPTDIQISQTSLPENSAIGTLIGTLTATDPDHGEPFTFALLPSDDSAAFRITGDRLEAASIFNFETQNSYSVTIKVTDSDNLTFNQTFTIAITDVNETPTVANEIPDRSGTYGGSLSFTLPPTTFSDEDNGQALNYAVVGLPQGIGFNNDTGVFSGTFWEVGLFPITVTASDDGTPPLNASDTFLISVDKAALTITATAENKVYDSNSTATVSLSTNALNGDDVSATHTTATFDTPDVGNGKSVSVTGISIAGTDASNYTLADSSLLTSANINARSLNVSATAEDKVYDANSSATVTLSTDAVNEDDVSATHAAATFDTPIVGDGKTVSVTGISITGDDVSNYTLADSSLLTSANVTARSLNVYVNAEDKVYDANSSATVTLSTDAVNEDDVSATHAAATFDTPNVGDGKTVSVTGISITGNDASNYTLADSSLLTSANINARSLNVSANADDKVYDGDSSATVTLSTNALEGDDVNATHAAATFDTPNVGDGKTVSVTGISIAGTDASNYTLADSSLLSSANITARLLDTTATAENKVYDGNTTATVSLSTNALNEDDVSATHTAATFDTPDVGNGKTVSVTGISIAGNDASNYTLADTSLLTSANITARSLNTTATAEDKVYDGNSSATVTLSTDTLDGDDVSVTHTAATFDTPDVGNGKTVSVTGISIGGSDASNYTLADPSLLTSASITTRSLNVSANAEDKVYDGNTSATVTLSTNALDGDNVSAAHPAATFDTPDVGNGKTVSVTGISITGTDASNYTLADSSLLSSANITARLLDTTATAENKVYDGNSSATVTLSTDALDGDDVSATHTAATFDTPDVGNGKTVSVTGISITGTDASNYTLADSSLLTSASINVRSLNVSADAEDKVYDRNLSATVTLATNALEGDDVTPTHTAATFDTPAVGNGKTVYVTGISIDGSDASNYTLADSSLLTSANITARSLTTTATAEDKAYDGNSSATVTLSTNALEGDDVSATHTAATFDTPNVGNGKTVSVTGISITGTDASNYTLADSSLLTSASINARPLNVSANAEDKVYDRNLSATVTLATNALEGDDVTPTHTAATFDTPDVGNGKTVSVTGISIAGTDASNYTLADTSLLTSANITVRSLNTTATAEDKVYDGNSSATVALSTNALEGDDVSATPTAATFDTPDVGNGKTVSITGVSIAGSDASNYTLADTSLLTSANITARSLTATATAEDKVYDGNSSATVTLSTDALDGDDASVTHTAATFDTPEVGNGKTVSVTGISIAGSDASNYTLADTSLLTSASITPATLEATADDATREYGKSNPPFTGSLTGVRSGDGITATYSSTATTTSLVGDYEITPTLTDPNGKLSNYTVSLTNGTLSITPSPLHVTITAPDSGMVGTIEEEITFTGQFNENGTGSNYQAYWTLIREGEVMADLTATITGTQIVDTFSFDGPGIYRVILTIEDAFGTTVSTDQLADQTLAYVVIVDPSHGHVTGGGWILSPQGALTVNPELESKATFGFTARYHSNRPELRGNLEFSIKKKNTAYRVRSTGMDWLVIANDQARLQGTCKLNNVAGFGFLLSVFDAGNSNRSNDAFRLQVWDNETGTMIYDNQMGDDFDSSPGDSSVLGGGSINLHRGKNKNNSQRRK